MKNGAILSKAWTIASVTLLLSLVALGLHLYKDYGISLDEPAQRLIGIVNVNYVSNIFNIKEVLNNPHFQSFANYSLFQLEDRHYGVIFEFPAALMELFFSENDDSGIYFARHLLTYIYFIVGLIAVYKISRIRYKNWMTGLLTCGMLLLSPRIFADAFYNSKDIVFLSIYAVTALTLIYFLRKPTWKYGILFGILSGLAIDTRLIAVVFPFLTAPLLLIKWKKLVGNKKVGLLLLVYVSTCLVTMVIFWPYLWSSPLGHFLEAFKFISLHPHSSAIPFTGKMFPTAELPWYYIAIWIGISTPVLYLALFVIGCISNLHRFISSKHGLFTDDDLLMDLVFNILFFTPIIAVAITHTPLYNGWRHLYFTYPFLLLIATGGLTQLTHFFHHKRSLWVIFVSIFAINSAWVGGWMIKNHPLQNLYFNFLAGKNWSESFEADYWGLAHRIALNKVLRLEPNLPITIWPGANSKFKSGEPTVFSHQLLIQPLEVKNRISSPESITQSKYVIASNSANYSNKYLSNHGLFAKIDSVSIDENEILGLFINRNFEKRSPPNLYDVISFAQNESGIFYLLKDGNPPVNWEQWNSNEWQIPENWGTWSNGKSSSLTIPTPKERAHSITLKVRPFIGQVNSKEKIQVWLNGGLAKSIGLEQAGSQTVEIDISSINQSAATINIEFKNLQPMSPQSLGISNDNRQIALGLESVQFR